MYCFGAGPITEYYVSTPHVAIVQPVEYLPENIGPKARSTDWHIRWEKHYVNDMLQYPSCAPVAESTFITYDQNPRI